MTIAGLHYVRKATRTGHVWHVYAWRGGPSIMRQEGGPRPVLTMAAIGAYQDAMRARHAAPEDTIAGLAGAWRGSPEWRALAPSTRDLWGRCLVAIEQRFKGATVEIMNDQRFRRHVMAWRATLAATPRAADYHIAVLRALFNWARINGRGIVVNHADGIPDLWKGGNRSLILWEPAEVDAIRPKLSQAVRDVFDLGRLTGLRRADCVALPRHAPGPHAIVWRTAKSGGQRVVTVPMIPALKALIVELRGRPRQPGVDTLLVNSRGLAWTPGGFTAQFSVERNAAGYDKHFHDLRGTYATELCEAGLTDQQIAGIMGWEPTRIAEIRRVYVDPARTVVAIGEALSARVAVNRPVNRSATGGAK